MKGFVFKLIELYFILILLAKHSNTRIKITTPNAGKRLGMKGRNQQATTQEESNAFHSLTNVIFTPSLCMIKKR